MRHPTEGTLRRLLDEPAGVADPDREHIAGCPVCLSELAAARQDAAVTRAALDVDLATAVGVALLLGGAGAAAAADWLQIFRTEQVAPVTVSEADLVELPDLTAYGDV